MAEFLEGQGFRTISIEGCFKYVWAKRVDRDGLQLSLRIYSGINFDGQSRGVGDDAIRVVCFWRDGDGAIHKVGGDKRVHRVKGWKANLQNRLDKWEEGLGPKCPKCGAPMRLREPKKQQTWKPFYGCLRWKPGDKGCNGTAPAKAAQKKSTSRPKRSQPRPKSDGAGEPPWERDDRKWKQEHAAEMEVMTIEGSQI